MRMHPMRMHLDQGHAGATVPANTQTATFIATGSLRPTTGAEFARADSEMRLRIGEGEAQPALQFMNTLEGSAVTTAVGQNMNANGPMFPGATATDIKINAAQYLQMRPGWLVKNTHATNTASMWLGGGIDVWGV